MKVEDISFIIPVFNRPGEIKELLDSFVDLEGPKDFEIVIIEDGSINTSEHICDAFKDKLNLGYFFKENSGPGDSRNYGMKMANGQYFIILDSDCILPPQYVNIVVDSLKDHFVDCFGGPDAAHSSFTNIQRAINFSMTSFITTGGIRGQKGSINKFQPRSFNMGISKEAFLSTEGFGNIHPGEDPDLSIRLEKNGFETKLIEKAFVYHKRRISWSKFFNQVYKFGMVRAVLNKWHPDTRKLTYWFPTAFIVGFLLALGMVIFGFKALLFTYAIYFIIALLLSWATSGSLVVAILSVLAIIIQFTGYGYGFLKSQIKMATSNKTEQQLFPQLFFK